MRQNELKFEAPKIIPVYSVSVHKYQGAEYPAEVIHNNQLDQHFPRLSERLRSF